MRHLSADALWSQAQAPEAGAAAHLEACAACREALEDVRRAQGLLALVPPPPPLPPAVAARVGAALAEAADRAAARRSPWWRSLWGSPLTLAAAAAVAVLAAWGLSSLTAGPARPAGPGAVPAPLAQQELPVPAAAPAAETAAPAPAPAPPAPRRRAASVASARRAHVQEKPAAVAQLLQQGDRLRTDRGGSLWLRLPDGSRAGLTGSTAVVLTRLEEQALELEVGQGSLALVVPHRADRTLTVRAGEVEVVDLGTRFSVSRSDSRVLVAVEEGEVEVRAGGAVQRLTAGHALSARGGQVATFPWAPVGAAPAAPPPPLSATAAAPEPAFVPSEAARLSGEEEPEPPPAASPAAPPRDALVRPDLDWAGLPPQERPPEPPAPSPPEGPVSTATPRPARVRRGPGFSLDELERRVQQFGQGLKDAILTPAAREAGMRALVHKSRTGACGAALVEADQWLAASPSTHPAEVEWRTEVLEARQRCVPAGR